MHRSLHALGWLIGRHRIVAWCLVGILSIVPVLGYLDVQLREPEWTAWASEEDVSSAEAIESFQFSGLPCVLVIDRVELFDDSFLQALHKLDEELEAQQAVAMVLWFGEVPAEGSLGLVPVLSLSEEGDVPGEALRERVLRHPLIESQLVSADGTVALVPIILAEWSREGLEQIRATADRLLEPHGARVRVTGQYPLWRAHTDAFEEDHDRILWIAYGLVVVLAWVIFRGPAAMIVACSGPVVGVLWATGWLKFLGEPHNELSEIVLPVMILMIGFTDGIHLVVHIRHGRADGLAGGEAAASAVTTVGPACALTSLTTAIGFGSLMIARTEMVQGFGRAAAIGVVVTFVGVILIVPLMSHSWLGRNLGRQASRDLVGMGLQRLEKPFGSMLRHYRLLSVAAVLLTVVLAAGALRLNPDDRLGHRVPRDSEAYRALADADEAMGGIRFLQLGITWREGTSPEQIWAVLEEVSIWFEQRPLFGEPLSVREWLTLVPGEPSHLKLAFADNIPEPFRSQFWLPNRNQALLITRMQDLGIFRYEPELRALDEELTRIGDRYETFTFHVTGEPLIEGRVVRRVVRELSWSLMLATTVIFAVMTIAYRSIRLGLLSLLPNVFPLVATAATRAVVNTSLDIASACAFTICLGIAVDDTIHFLSRFERERKRGVPPIAALRGTFRIVGTALVTTTVVMMSGFATVMTSQLPTHRSFAALGCTTIAAALVADLIMLPALLAWFPGRHDGDSSEDGAEPEPAP